jgi:uncharacterized membrane protein YfcA
MEILGYLFLFFVGLALGTLGTGGSILAVPILVYLFSVDAVMASAYSLFIVGTTSFVGTVLKYNAELVDFKTGFIFGIPSIISIFSTRKWIVPSIPDIILQLGAFQLTKRALILGILAFLMIFASLCMITRGNKYKSHPYPKYPFFLILLGLLTGMVTGFVGVGGGFLIIPILGFLTKMPFKKVVGTTLLIIASNSLIGFIGDIINYTVHWNFLLILTGLAVFGIYIGSLIAKMLPTLKLQKSFGWFTLAIGTSILVREIFFY